MLMPTVSRYMTREPYSVASTANLDRARALLISHGIRHLPVIDGDKLVGVLARAEVDAVASVPGVELTHVEVARVMTPPIHVWSETPLDEVSDLMSDKRADCVVVMGGHGVQGIFTAIDALRALSELLRRAAS